MSTAHSPLFEHLTGLLTPLSPAELHGLLCGLLCADDGLSSDQWLHHAGEVLAEGAELSDPVRDVLEKLLQYGIAQMQDADGSITPLLPDDDAPLNQRADALGAWCQGLLYGLGLGQAEQHGILSEESQEFLRDATEIAQVGFDTDETGEADETAYVEVVEYLRVGLLLIHSDLHSSATSDSVRLH
ncbi:MAG: UPF0149 family protein [Candidatus Competibacteraceae bacterium]|nr:UPF0149 family protein [Candidatus Competibacteraceae bacterium]MBK8750449.1 UPF0149 family protein [Candidatus Competibacteraceae bacterium]